jgi:GT2 family glycosyltransferase
VFTQVLGQVLLLPTSAVAEEPTPLLENLLETPREVLWGSYGRGGAALYRHSILEQVGTFNPYLCSDEEPELGLRIRQAGYRLLELDYPIVRHYNVAPVAFSTVLSRRRRNFLLGISQGARYYLRSKLLWPWLKADGGVPRRRCGRPPRSALFWRAWSLEILSG